MTSEKLYGILALIDALDTKLDLQRNLDSINTALSNLVNSPAAPQYQSELANSLASFEGAASPLQSSISPSQAEVIKQMGGEEFFDPAMFSKVKSAVQTNAMTPSVARDFVKDLAARRTKFLTTVRAARQSLEKLNIQETAMQVGGADLAFLIPRDIFKNQLGSFAKELAFINRLVEHFSEAITGEAQSAELEQLSSSVPTIAIVAAIPVILKIAEVANKFLEAWQKIEKIRRMRSELSDMGLKGAALDELTDQVQTTVTEVVEESTQLVLAKYPGEATRKAELENGLRDVTLKLFGQIERGLTVEVRANPDGGQPTQSTEDLKMIAQLAKTMTFPEPAKQPMLLASGDVVDGEFIAASYSKKTTTTKKTSTKKTSKDGGDVDSKG